MQETHHSSATCSESPSIADDDNGAAVLAECNEDNNVLKITKGLCK